MSEKKKPFETFLLAHNAIIKCGKACREYSDTVLRLFLFYLPSWQAVGGVKVDVLLYTTKKKLLYCEENKNVAHLETNGSIGILSLCIHMLSDKRPAVD